MNDESKDSWSLGTVVVALALVLVAAAAPALVGARPANEIPVSDLPDAGDSLTNASSDAWEQVPAKEIALASAPSGAPNAENTTIESVFVRAAQDDERLFVRLSWADPTPDTELTPGQYETPRLASFGDAAAVQLPANASTHPGIAMGSERTPVNVWYWNAEAGGQELLAAGPGTTTAVEGTVETDATYRDGRWHVVFDRNLGVEETNRTSFEADENVQVALAVWNGSNAERAGQKAVSEWQYFPLGPGPQGPPYETILWTIAGLAVVVVVVVTVIGTRRS